MEADKVILITIQRLERSYSQILLEDLGDYRVIAHHATAQPIERIMTAADVKQEFSAYFSKDEQIKLFEKGFSDTITVFKIDQFKLISENYIRFYNCFNKSQPEHDINKTNDSTPDIIDNSRGMCKKYF